MGRILFIMFVAFIMLLVIMVINKYLNSRNGNKPMSKEEKRKSFDEDIEAVAKEIKMRREA